MSNQPVADRFWMKVQRSPGCWDWRGGKIRQGYGQFWYDKKHVAAHRFSYELHFGPIPELMMVLHRCDNPVCVRPDHLFVGTAKDNAVDSIAKGRFSRLRQPGLWEEATRRFLAGEPKKAIARRLSITPASVRYILRQEGLF